MIQIENDLLKASFLTKGAELRSLVSIGSGKEWMWNADPRFWGKTSPILFPIVGGLRDNTYQFEGVNYQLPRHGFARDMEFEIRSLQADRVVFGLVSSDESRKIYPFDFYLEVSYTLKGAELKVEYLVKNVSERELYFSLGAHPAFAIDVDDAKAFTDYALVFEDDDELHLHPLHNNLLQKATDRLPLEHRKLNLSYSLFENDALVMTDMQSKKIKITNKKDDQEMSFCFTNFPYFGIWSAHNANFVCLEPWAGIADFEDHDGDLSKKFGINVLQPGGMWQAEWFVAIGK